MVVLLWMHIANTKAWWWLPSVGGGKALHACSFSKAYMVPGPYLFTIFQALWNVEESLTMQLFCDCSVIPSVIKLEQESENQVMKDLFYLSRTYVFKIFVT